MQRRQSTILTRAISRIGVGVFVAAVCVLAASAASAEITPEQRAEMRATVESSMTSNQTEVRRMAVLALGAMLEDRKDVKAFRKHLDDADPVIKRAAAVALAMRGERAGTKAIHEILESTEEENLASTIAELIRPLDDPTRKKILERVVEKPANEALRKAALEFIARDGSDDLYALTKEVEDIRDTETRNALADILIKYPRPASLERARGLYESDDASTRIKGLELARAIDSHDSKQLIAKALDDKDETVVKAATEMLEAMKHPALVPVLEQRVKDDPKDAEAIALLVELDAPDLVETLKPVVAAENPSLEQDLYNQILALVAASKTDEAKDLVRQKLGSTYEKDRIAAAWALGYTQDTSFTQQALTLVTDGSLAVREAAARSLGKLGDPAAIKEMNRLLGAAADKSVKLNLIRSMGEIGDDKAGQYLQFLVTERDTDIRMAALDALADLKASDATKAVEVVARDADPALRWHAVVTLFLIDPVVYGERLKKAVSDAPEDLFFETLAELDPEMQKKLEDEVLRSDRSALAAGLVRSWIDQGRAGIPRLRDAVDIATDKDVTHPAIKALARYAEPEDLDRIKKFVDASDRKLRLRMLQTLLRYDKSKTQDVFEGLLDSDDPMFKVLGIYGLMR